MKASRPLLSVLPAAFVVVLLAGCAGNDKPPISVAPLNSSLGGNHRAVQDALQMQGRPYAWGGESPREGFDCSGLVFYVYNQQGIRLPRDTWSLAKQLPSVQLDQRQPGDLVFFSIDTKPFSHVGIYVGEDRFIHAPSSRTGQVIVSDLKGPYWRKRFMAVRRPPSHRPLSLNNGDSQFCALN